MTTSLRERITAIARRTGWRPAHYAVLAFAYSHLLTSGNLAGANDWRYVFYPWADTLRISILRYHQFPWWNPWPIAGEPLFADPQAPVLVPDTILLLIFGSVLGLKLVIFLYTCIGYEGTRLLSTDLFGKTRAADAACVIPALFPALALHYQEGHVVFIVFLLFPWVLALCLTWQKSTWRALGLGIFVAWHFLSYVHYSIIITFTICGPFAAVGLFKNLKDRQMWLRLGLVICTAFGLSIVRIAVTGALLGSFPRHEPSHYPIAFGLENIILAMVQPFQDRYIPIHEAGLNWWELDSYVGLVVLFCAYEALRGGRKLGAALVFAGALCIALAFNNRDKIWPSYWLHWIRPWDHMVVITRWRLYGGYFFLLAAVYGLSLLYKQRRTRLAWALGLAAIFDLTFHIRYAIHDTFVLPQPPYGNFDSAPVSVHDDNTITWDSVRLNHVSLGSWCSMLGYGIHYPARQWPGMPGYKGEFPGLTLVKWTPNAISLTGHPGDHVSLNMNPSNYWTMNGERLYPDDKEIEIYRMFDLVVPPDGRVELRASPPHLNTFILIQAGFAVAALAIFFALRRSERVRPEAS